MVAAFRERREVIVSGLNAIPVSPASKPDGAFYAFPNDQELGQSAATLADRLLEEAGVACLPARRSAGTARTTCASPTRTRSTTSAARSTPSPPSSAERLLRDPPHAFTLSST